MNFLQVHAGVQLQQELAACSTMTVVALHDYGRRVQSFLIQLLLEQNFVNNQYSKAFRTYHMAQKLLKVILFCLQSCLVVHKTGP